jgi:hypothetical protein
MFRAEAHHRRNASSSSSKFDGLKLWVWLCTALLPWVAIFVFHHKLFGI